jgi:DNA-directed RNA polymerase specialized sigma24 family protein
LLSLSPGRREAVVRFLFGGRSQQQIAEELHCSVDAVRNSIQKGLAQCVFIIGRLTTCKIFRAWAAS